MVFCCCKKDPSDAVIIAPQQQPSDAQQSSLTTNLDAHQFIGSGTSYTNHLINSPPTESDFQPNSVDSKTDISSSKDKSIQKLIESYSQTTKIILQHDSNQACFLEGPDNYIEIANIIDKLGVKEEALELMISVVSSAIKNETFNKSEPQDYSNAIPKGFIEEKYGGKQHLYLKLRKLGIHIGANVISGSKLDYKSFKNVLYLHRHMMARAQGTPDYQNFGIPISDNRAFIVTELSDQFPLSAKKILLNFDNFENCSELLIKRVSRILISARPDIINNREPGTLGKAELKVIAPHESILGIECFKRATLSVLIKLESPSSSEDEGILLAVHGINLVGDGYKVCIYDELSIKFEAIRELSRKENLNENDQVTVKNVCSGTIFIESQLTPILRGGGAVPEMIADSILVATSQSIQVAQLEGYNIWGESMSYPNHTEFEVAFSGIISQNQ